MSDLMRGVNRAIGAGLCILLALAACGTSSNPLTRPQLVFVIVMENHSADQALQGKYR